MEAVYNYYMRPAFLKLLHGYRLQFLLESCFLQLLHGYNFQLLHETSFLIVTTWSYQITYNCYMDTVYSYYMIVAFLQLIHGYNLQLLHEPVFLQLNMDLTASYRCLMNRVYYIRKAVLQFLHRYLLEMLHATSFITVATCIQFTVAT